MIRIDWVADPHFDHATNAGIAGFLAHANLPQSPAKAHHILVTGDLAQCNTLEGWLRTIAKNTESSRAAIYFVLGNHDAYYGSVLQAETIATECSRQDKRLVYLPAAGVVKLTDTTALVGVDGWYDGIGAVDSDFRLSDHTLIEELSCHVGVHGRSRDRLPEAVRRAVGEQCLRLAQRSADQAEALLAKAFERFESAVLVTHVPPYEEAARYQGMPNDANARPYFVNHPLGDALHRAMEAHPQKSLTVLCGHTHADARYQARPNLTVRCGHSDYGHPAMQAPLWVP